MAPKPNFLRVMTNLLVVVFLLWLAGTTARAIPPRPVTDFELVEDATIVVGKWEKAPFKDGVTDLKIERVLKGELQPGVHPLFVESGFRWDGDGRRPADFDWSPQPVESVTQSTVWILKKQKGEDAREQRAQLSVSFHSQIQPVELENYFAALAVGKPKETVVKLLGSAEPKVVARTLSLIEQVVLSHELEKKYGHSMRPSGKSEPDIGDPSEAVKEVIARSKSESDRAVAIKTVAKLGGAKSALFLRGLLTDPAVKIQWSAAEELLKLHDVESIEKIPLGIAEGSNEEEACAIIRAAVEWQDVRLVPLLNAFLEKDRAHQQHPEYSAVPALEARAALHKITGQWFPFSVERARKAWSQVVEGKVATEDKAGLAALFPEPECPLGVEIVGDGTGPVTFKVSNNSLPEVTILRSPDTYEESWSTGSSAGSMTCYIGGGKSVGKEDFVTLKLGEAVTFPFAIGKEFLDKDPSIRRVSLKYLSLGGQWGKNPWIGEVKANFGKEWKGPKVEETEEKWQNGNLKAKGGKFNGRKVGEWHYFNLYGNRIRIENHTENTKTKCDPDAPENEGAGRREK